MIFIMSKRRYVVWTYRFIASGRLPEGKSQVKRFGVSIHHANTAI